MARDKSNNKIENKIQELFLRRLVAVLLLKKRPLSLYLVSLGILYLRYSIRANSNLLLDNVLGQFVENVKLISNRQARNYIGDATKDI